MSEPERLEDFACCHNEGEAAMTALLAEVCEALECEPDRLVTAVVHELNMTYDVIVTAIPTDMWSAVRSEHGRYVDNEWVVDTEAYIQCDRVEDGFALTWKTWKEWSETKK